MRDGLQGPAAGPANAAGGRYGAGPIALVVRAPGTNCDLEMVRGFELAGARVEVAHLEALCADLSPIERASLVGFPGGFSYGDDIASGRIFASRIRARLLPALLAARDRGVAMIGACNGFQVLVQTGLLPGPMGDRPDGRAPRQTVALADNASARFCGSWVGVQYEAASVCVWTAGLAAAGLADEASMLPVAHGEGRFVAADAATLEALERSGQVAVRYASDHNGSQNRIAGICDATGLIFGLMPHPERFLDWNRHPFWTRLEPAMRGTITPGLAMFRNAVSHVTAGRGQAQAGSGTVAATAARASR